MLSFLNKCTNFPFLSKKKSKYQTLSCFFLHTKRRNRLVKNELNNGNPSLGFRQLEVSERQQDAVEASDEPIYELEIMVAGDRESREPLITENVYSDLNDEQIIACSASSRPYNEPHDWNKALSGGVKQQTEAPSGDLMADDVTGNVYDEVLFRYVSDFRSTMDCNRVDLMQINVRCLGLVLVHGKINVTSPLSLKF